MAVYEYAEAFTNLLQQKYAKDLCSDALTKSNPGVKFINLKTIKLPRMTVSGYKDHTRTPGFNAGTMSNDYEAKVLAHDRDIEFWVDPMDIDETNLTLSVANIQNTFETEQAIPEKDSYRFSKLYTELKDQHRHYHRSKLPRNVRYRNVLHGRGWSAGGRPYALRDSNDEEDCKRGRGTPEGYVCDHSVYN